ncbi:MAG: hypothetical protein PUJ19_01755, partial [Campylobacteraceae bacterium]|nr:hypothetical protein [Campylobacteraceae bacterium]MDY4121871.1 hypothetical protein [Campylobacter sp.]
ENSVIAKIAVFASAAKQSHSTPVIAKIPSLRAQRSNPIQPPSLRIPVIARERSDRSNLTVIASVAKQSHSMTEF